MEEIKKDRKKIIKVLSLIVSIVLIIALGTFAWITWQSSENTELTMTIGQLAEVTFETGNDITAGKLAPVLDYNSGETTTFNINNKSTGYYRAYVTLNITSIDSELQNEHFKYIILKSDDNSTFEPIIEGTFKDIVVGDNNIGDILLYAKSKTYYKFIMYIDSNEENDVNMMGKSIVGTINVGANNESEPNIPNISNGLIPVTYNGSTWVKADETNEGNSWYNYDEKKWANAVLVRDSNYAENVSQTNKSVSIDNSSVESKVYTSSNKGVNSSTSASTLTFTTGSTAGNLSFDYSVSSESGWDKYTISINGTTVVSEISGTVSDTYTQALSANTEYVITVSYVKDSGSASGDDQATISNISIPSGSSTIVNAASGSYGWTETSVTRYKINTYNSYSLNDMGVYSLSGVNNVSAADSVGKYICSDTTSTKCSEIYEVTGTSGSTITAVDVYGTIVETGIREGYTSADVGTTIPEEDVLAYYVWIPRYKYKVFNINKEIGVDSYSAETKGIDIIWESGIESTGNITCNDYNFSITDGSLSETCSGSNGEYYTHPAFTFGEDELTGLWVGKFEISSNDISLEYGGGESIDLSVRIKPNVISWRYNYVTNFSKVIQNMSLENNEYGLTTTAESHMLKNTEWGAVAYLTHSGYGRCSGDGCEELTVNSNGSYYTGGNAYATNVGQSTTGNIYGVYDMSGGAYEYVMGNMSSAAGSYTYYASSGGSNFTYSEDTAKYIDTYANGSSKNNQTAYNRARLGDATGEVAKSSGYGWNNDFALFVGSSISWFGRGGFCSYGSYAGVFGFDGHSGGRNTSYSARAALVGAP